MRLPMDPSCKMKMRRTSFEVRSIYAGFRQQKRSRERLVRKDEFAPAGSDPIQGVVPQEFLEARRG